MKIAGHDIGVCSWSLKTPQIPDLIAAVKDLGLSHIQLALGPLLAMDATARDMAVEQLKSSGLNMASGMVSFPGEDYTSIETIRHTGGIIPDATWPQRQKITLAAAPLAQRLGINKISTHLGFVPPANDPAYEAKVQRVASVAKEYASHGVQLLFETGQERASELRQFLHDVAAAGGSCAANFDPANMILYGCGDPIEAVRILAGLIGQIHIKDAVASDEPGRKWGREVAFGKGQVDPRQFLNALADAHYAGPLIIEREADNQRMDDVRFAIDALRTAAR